MTITIPAAALEAAARAAHNQWRLDCAKADKQPVENWPGWEELEEFERQEWIAQTRAAALALLEAWPGARMGSEDFYDDVAGMLCLPLTQEKHNADR